jgi:hypothetical protein
MAKPGARDHFATLMRVNERAFTAGQYEVAYHALMGALHAAQDRDEADQLETVAELARAQQQTIDSASPDHPISSLRAHEHGAVGVYALASRQASTQALIARRRAGHG